jgi:T4-like virus tail tube protein gp19
MALKREAYPRDPLRNFRFQLHFGDLKSPIAGVQRASGLSFSVSSYEVWEGGNNLHRHVQPDRVTWDPITLETGLMLDSTLFDWTEQLRRFLGDKTEGWPDSSPSSSATAEKPDPSRTIRQPPLKRTVYLSLWDPLLADEFMPALSESTDILEFEILNAWPSKLVAVPKLDGLGAEVAFQTLELVHEGWRLTKVSADMYPKILASRTATAPNLSEAAKAAKTAAAKTS